MVLPVTAGVPIPRQKFPGRHVPDGQVVAARGGEGFPRRVERDPPARPAGQFPLSSAGRHVVNAGPRDRVLLVLPGIPIRDPLAVAGECAEVEAGAEFVLTRPIFEPDVFERVSRRLETSRLPVIATVYAFDSARNAEFMANEVPGLRVPDALIDRMRRADQSGDAPREGVTLAREIARALRGRVQGVLVSTAAGSADRALAVLDGLRKG